MPDTKTLNIHQKILKIADAAGVLQKTKSGHNYKYVPEEEIQAKVTACMQKYGVMLYPSIVPGTLTVEPYSNEVIVKAEVTYTWVDADNPSDTIECRWAYIGQMRDASQAFGAGATYGNRYYLMKALQLATTEADPDNYRSKQKEAGNYDLEKELASAIKEVVDKGTALIGKGVPKEEVTKIVSKLNNDNPNPSSIKSIEICASIIEEFKKLEATKKE